MAPQQIFDVVVGHRVSVRGASGSRIGSARDRLIDSSARSAISWNVLPSYVKVQHLALLGGSVRSAASSATFLRPIAGGRFRIDLRAFDEASAAHVV